MLKKMISISLISLLGLTMVACSNNTVEQTPQQEDAASEVKNEEAENIIRQFEATQSSVTYKDPQSFIAGDKYLTADFAKVYHEQIRAGMEQFLKDSKGTVSGEEPTISFYKQEGDNLIYNFEVDRIITIEQPEQSITSHVKYLVTVTKQKDGSYLISDMKEVEEN